MYLNYFHYFRRMTASLCENGMRYPPQWHCPAQQQTTPPEWFDEIGLFLETLDKEVLLVTREVEETRKLVIHLKFVLSERPPNLS